MRKIKKYYRIGLYLFMLLPIFLYSQSKSERLYIYTHKKDTAINLKNIDFQLINKGVLYHTNQHRKKKRKKQLLYNTILEKAAAIHSQQMKNYSFFDHINKRNRKFKHLDDRTNAVGYNNYVELAENIYIGFVDIRNLPTYNEIALEITKAFISSRSHNLNLIDKNLKEIGMSLVFKEKSEGNFLYYYFTQDFGTR